MIHPQIQAWFDQHGWKPFEFQQQVWEHIRQQRSGLLHAPTGSGKTLAAFLGLVNHVLWNQTQTDKRLRLLWITPLRALAADLQKALQQVVTDLALPWSVELRTGDSDHATKKRQERHLPEVLIITPESLHLLLTRANHPELLGQVDMVVTDEWHELFGTKRGVLVELGLARVHCMNPGVLLWAISATIGNLEQAAEVALYTKPPEERVLVTAAKRKPIDVRVIHPPAAERYPWAGHLGLSLVAQVVPLLHQHRSTLIFTNTRSQAELWYRELLEKDPDLAGALALHHGSIDHKVRTWVEQALKDGRLKAVVCTSSLDLGVDFFPVDAVVQVGSPKGVARFMQRAGRSGHRPDQSSLLYFVPTHALELIDLEAFRAALDRGYIESRRPVLFPFDVLVQYLVTRGMGGGFQAPQMRQEVQSCHAFAGLSDRHWAKVMDIVTYGGNALKQYPEFRRLVPTETGYQVEDKTIQRRHRMSIGTILSDASVKIAYLNGGYLGTIEESFMARLTVGDRFWFSGRNLELVKLDKQTAYVRRTQHKDGIVPQWMGGNMPLSSEVSSMIREQIHHLAGQSDTPASFRTIETLLNLQKERSILPSHSSFLIEQLQTKEGYHLFFYPFEGRLLHEGMASLLAYRISKQKALSFSMAMNDYGFELLSDQPIPVQQAVDDGLFHPENLEKDLRACLNASELSQRKFREIARISGMIFTGYPGQRKNDRNLQASSSLIYQVLQQYDPEHLLLEQANDEVLYDQLEHERLRQTMKRIHEQTIVIQPIERYTPLCFPILVDRLRQKLSFEQLEDRIRRMIREADRGSGIGDQ